MRVNNFIRPVASVKDRERGIALMVVLVVLGALLVGGLGVVRLSTAELSSAGGARQSVEYDACVEAGLEHARAMLPNTTAVSDATASVGGALSYRPGHFNSTAGGTTTSAEVIDSTLVDVSAAAGAAASVNLTNRLGLSYSSGGAPAGGVLDQTQLSIVRINAVCDDGIVRREAQQIIRYGLSAQ